jgi:thiol-disulfide isomerase/thioredoxin
MLIGAIEGTGQQMEALAVCDSLEQLCRVQFGQTDELTLSAGADRAWLLMELGRLETAATLARDVHARAARGFGESHGVTRETRSVLGAIFIAQGSLDEARALYGNRRIPTDLGIERSFQGDPEVLSDGPQLFVFFETWCPFSRNAMPELEEQYRQFREQGIEFVGLTRINRSATEETVEQFIRDWGISFAIAKESGSAWDFFECGGTPTMRLVDNGQLLWESSWHPNARMLEGIIRVRQAKSSGDS